MPPVLPAQRVLLRCSGGVDGHTHATRVDVGPVQTMTSKKRPILFSGPMVRAILAGRKTQTRRVVKPQPLPEHWRKIVPGWYQPTVIRRGIEEPGNEAFGFGDEYEDWTCPYGAPGDRLWVRESGWQPPEVTRAMAREGADTWPRWMYAADDPDKEWLRSHGWIPRPSIHMPRWASRITLEVTGVRVERVQDVSEEDAIAEGVDAIPIAPAALTRRTSFAGLWDRINAKRGHSWASNPWVWVVEFRRVQGNDGE